MFKNIWAAIVAKKKWWFLVLSQVIAPLIAVVAGSAIPHSGFESAALAFLANCWILLIFVQNESNQTSKIVAEHSPKLTSLGQDSADIKKSLQEDLRRLTQLQEDVEL